MKAVQKLRVAGSFVVDRRFMQTAVAGSRLAATYSNPSDLITSSMKSDPAPHRRQCPQLVDRDFRLPGRRLCCALIVVLLPAIAAALAASCRKLAAPTDLCCELFWFWVTHSVHHPNLFVRLR